MKNVATISFVTILGVMSAACSETPEEKAARTAREFCSAGQPNGFTSGESR